MRTDNKAKAVSDSVYRYTSQEAFDSHMASKPVQDLIASFAADPTLLSAPPTMTISDLVQGYTRPEISSCADPYIAVGSLEYKEGKRVEALEGWKKVASETEMNEGDTLSYGIYKNREHPETVKVVEFYRSEEYFKQVHVPSKAIQENLQKYGNEIRASVSHVWLKHVAGFLVKGKGSSSL
jgi:quinol monooxygenase YgiN